MPFPKPREYPSLKIPRNRLTVADDPNLLNTSLYINLCIFADKNDIFDKNEIIL